jgi:hypothetical protein
MKLPRWDGNLSRNQAAVLCSIGVIVNLIAMTLNILVFSGWLNFALIFLHSSLVLSCVWAFCKVRKR